MKAFRLDQTPNESEWRFETLYVDPEFGNDEWWCGVVNNNGVVQIHNNDLLSIKISENPIKDVTFSYFEKLSNGFSKIGSDNSKRILPMKASLLKKFPSFPFHIQPKIEGIRMLCYLDGNNLVQYSALGTLYNIPFLDEIKKLFLYLPRGTILDGELYNHDLPFSEIISIVKNKKRSKNILQYFIFDFHSEQQHIFKVRNEILQNIFKKNFFNFTNCKYIECEEVYDKLSFDKKYIEYISKNYEGIMIKISSGIYKSGKNNLTLKLKNFEDFEVKVVNIENKQLICGKDNLRVNYEEGVKIGDIITIKIVNSELIFVSVRDYE